MAHETWVVAHLKGGVAKTTTCGYLGQVMHDAAWSVVGVDSDDQNRGLSVWGSVLPWPVHLHTGSDLHRAVPRLSADADLAVVDTPPVRGDRQVVLSALLAATKVLVPMAPTGADYAQMGPMVELLEEADRERGGPVPWAVVLVRCPGYPAKSPGVYRQQLVDDGVRVLTAQVPQRELFAQAQGRAITRAGASAYGDVALEFLKMEVQA